MILWLDEHLSPQLADWITRSFRFDALHIRDLDLARAKDRAVFDAARQAGAIILTKMQISLPFLRGSAHLRR